MRVVVRTTTDSIATDSDASSGPDAPASDGEPTPPSGRETATADGETAPHATGSGTGADADAVVVPETEGAGSRPRRVPSDEPITCHGYTEGRHGLKLTDANGEQCGYVPYDELLRIVPE
jgi:hypothetical protein